MTDAKAGAERDDMDDDRTQTFPFKVVVLPLKGEPFVQSIGGEEDLHKCLKGTMEDNFFADGSTYLKLFDRIAPGYGFALTYDDNFLNRKPQLPLNHLATRFMRSHIVRAYVSTRLVRGSAVLRKWCCSSGCTVDCTIDEYKQVLAVGFFLAFPLLTDLFAAPWRLWRRHPCTGEEGTTTAVGIKTKQASACERGCERQCRCETFINAT